MVKLVILTAICGFCCGILFMLIPAVTVRFKRLLHINGETGAGGYPAPQPSMVNSRAMHPTVDGIMDTREVLRQRGVVVRQRRSL